MSIIVKDLSKSFTYYKKELGLKNSIKNLFKREQLTKEAVRNISFEIGEGEIVGFLGPNGAGKTTTLKMLSGILFPTYGNATVMGYVPWERKKAFKMNFSIVMGQKSQLWWDLPANESLFLNKHIYELSDDQYNKSLEELTELLDVKELLKVQVRRLSLGERMKMEIIAVLIHKPKVILLDEPTIGLDIISQKKIREFLKYYNEQTKTTIMLTSHYIKDIEAMCKRTIVINNGLIVYDGELNDINNVFGQKKILKLRFEEEISKTELESFGDLKVYDGFNATIEVEKSEIRRCSNDIFNRFSTADFNIEDIPIEDGISALFERSKK